jgi:hypothetical protein
VTDWFTVRRQARRDVHDAFSLIASYSDSTPASATGLHVRWHSRFTAAIGDIPGGDYARVMENIDRLIFDLDELTVTLKRGGVVVFDDYPGQQFMLDVREPADGPVIAIWTVTRP